MAAEGWKQMNEQLTINEQLLQKVSTLEKWNEEHERRINKNESLTVQIHTMIASVDNLSKEVKALGERQDKMMVIIDERLKTHGERMGELEKFKESQALAISKYGDRLKDLECYIDKQKTKGTRLLSSIAEKIAWVVAGAVVMFLLYQIGL